jgi:hypothetical protein
VEVKMPLYPATKLMDTVIADLFDFPTTEPTAPQAVHTPGALLFSSSSEPTWTAIGNTDAHAPLGEDSWGLWQIDVDPTGASADLWEWRKQVMDGTIKDALDFQPQLTSEPTAPDGDDGGIIIDWTPGQDDEGFLIVNWLAEDHVDPSDPSDDLKPTESLTLSDGFIIADYAEPTAHHPMYPTFDVVGSPTEII